MRERPDVPGDGFSHFFGRSRSDLLGVGRNAPAHRRECETTKGARESRELARINPILNCVTAVIGRDDGE